MSTPTEGDASPADDFVDDLPTEPGGNSEIPHGSGQSMGLALLTAGTLLALALAIVAIIMAGSDGSSGDAAADGPVTELSVTAVDLAFEPDAWSVAADTEISVDFVNSGAAPHNWTVLDQGTSITTEDEFDPSLVLVATSDVAGAAAETITGTFAAGSYQVICTIPGHFSAGMTGTLDAA